jgi:hypothetical protein
MNGDAAGQVFPSVYRLAGFWRCAMLFLAAAALYVGGLGTWHSWIGHEAFGSSSAFLAAFDICCLVFAFYLIAFAARARLVLTSDEIRVTGAFATRTMGREEILGYRTYKPRNTPTNLILVAREESPRNVRVSGMFRKNAVIQEWLGGLPDLDASDVESARKELESNPALGATPDERARSIQQDRRILRWLGAAAAVGWLGGWILPSSVRICDLVLLAVPWTALYISARSRGVIGIGIRSRKQVPELDVTAVFLLPQLILSIRNLGETEVTLIGWRESLALAILFGAILTFAAWKTVGAPRGQGLWVFLLLLSIGHGYATVKTADVLLDRAQPAVYRTVVVGKRVSQGKTTSYWLHLAPWGPRKAGDRVEVSKGFHDARALGDTVCVDLHQGALMIPWYSVSSCP